MFLKTALRTLALSLVLALPLHSYASEPPESEIEEIVTPGADDDEIYTVWTRVRDGFKIPNMENSVVDENLAKYSKRPDYLQRMANRSQKYLYHIIEEVTARGMPTEIALLPFVESAFVTNAKSRVKAAGLWQASITNLTRQCGKTNATMFYRALRRRLLTCRDCTTNSTIGRLPLLRTTGEKAMFAARLSATSL